MSKLSEFSDLELAKEMAARRPSVVEECIKKINQQIEILDGFGVNIISEQDSNIKLLELSYDSFNEKVTYDEEDCN